MFLKFDSEKSILDEVFSDCLAQEDTGDPVNPLKVSWDKCTTKLKDIDTHKVHWVRPPNQSYIMIDFDLLDAEGNKSPEKNLMAASQFKPTYGELSRGGGVHLIYIYRRSINRIMLLCSYPFFIFPLVTVNIIYF